VKLWLDTSLGFPLLHWAAFSVSAFTFEWNLEKALPEMVKAQSAECRAQSVKS
jgi:hypothetical protein